ncbi:histone-lysine N-methyltransferase ATXR2-like [Rutidosis leptorrhynchoides]|uniref:histone-lysine N-methyltransferase ATXR2-like n=1 Tax=Rutidosis leptorrhynchoides TaxID=125765 RepID=UPI003A99DFB3
MESVCSIDESCAAQISSLLQSPPPLQVQEYFEKLIPTRKCHGITVKQNGDFGKGVFAKSEFKEGELILKDQMLVGIQHASNRMECFVCSYCFKFVGSIELQMGRRLYFQNIIGPASSNNGRGASTSSHGHCSDTDSSEEEDFSVPEKETIPLPDGVVESLMDGGLVFPYSDKFPLPTVISCPGGCDEAQYCSKSCADADWEFFHSLLCTCEKSESLSREALSNFIQHAVETNDIFLLAAKAISSTVLRYRKLKTTYFEKLEKHKSSDVLDRSNLLLEAWKPISIGHKQRWWDCVGLPDDVDDEMKFRMEIKELAFTSLQLLKAAIFDKECEALFSLEIYGHIIGMFELNNLDLVVASPVQDYFSYIDDLAHPQKEKAEKITRPLLDALGDDYSVCCEGSAFYSLQSCMNHSCCPNAEAFKREEDRDGRATILCLRPICKGEEITISYIDEDLPFDERQALLADYGFKCKCPKCVEEEDPQ